jgi:outer membrane protein TolC
MKFISATKAVLLAAALNLPASNYVLAQSVDQDEEEVQAPTPQLQPKAEASEAKPDAPVVEEATAPTSADPFDDLSVSPSAGPIPLSLGKAIHLAQERSFRVARSRRNAEMAQLRYRNAKSAYLPRANFGLNADQSARGFTYAADRFNTDQPTQGEFRGGAVGDLSVPIDFAGVIKRQVGQASASRQISRHEVAQSSIDIALETQTNYLNALRAQNNADADAGVAAEIEDLIARSRKSTPGAVPFLEVELGNAKQALSTSRESADRAQEALKQTLRIPPEARLRLTTSFTDRKEPLEREQLLQRALAGRPDIQQALLRIRQADISARQVYDQRKPTLRVGAFYNDQLSGGSIVETFKGGADRFRNQGIGLNVTLPVVQWDNGNLKRQKRIALIQKDQAEADRLELEERVGYEIRQALLTVERSESRLKTLPKRQQARAALDRAEQQMLAAPAAEAQSLLAQVTNARTAWRSAETASGDAYIDYNNAIFRLKRIIGDRNLAPQNEETVIAAGALASTATP